MLAKDNYKNATSCCEGASWYNMIAQGKKEEECLCQNIAST